MLPQLRVLLLGVDPEDPAEILRSQVHLGPVLSALAVPLISRRSSEGQTQTDDETGNREKHGAYTH